MAKINFLILNIFIICASAFVAVHGDDYAWIPATVRNPAEQCKYFFRNSPGRCELAEEHKSSICQRLECAVPKRGGTIVKGLIIAGTGSICGPSHVCRKKKCTKVPAEKLPKETGSKDMVSCITVW